MFCDASKTAYSAVAYLQWEERDGEMAVSLVASKSRVAPLNKIVTATSGADGNVNRSKAGKKPAKSAENSFANNSQTTHAQQLREAKS